MQHQKMTLSLPKKDNSGESEVLKMSCFSNQDM